MICGYNNNISERSFVKLADSISRRYVSSHSSLCSVLETCWRLMLSSMGLSLFVPPMPEVFGVSLE